MRYRVLADLDDGSFIVVLDTSIESQALACSHILYGAIAGEWGSKSQFIDVHLATNETGEWVEVI